MAWQFVRLKFRLSANSIRAGDVWSTLGVMAMWVGSAGLGLVGGLLLAVLLGRTDEGLAVAIAVTIQAAWILVPVAATALDATLDPRSFELLPLTSGELGRGLLAASAAGPGGLFTVLGVGLGFGGGLWPGWMGMVTVPVLTLLLAFIGVVSGRLATVVISEFLTGAKLTEAASVVFGLLAVAVVVVSISIDSNGGTVTGLGLPDWLGWLALLPSGAIGAAFASLNRGEVVAGMGLAMWAAVGAAALTWAYGRALARMRTRPPTRRRNRAKPEADLLGAALAGLLPSAPVRAAAAKELRYLRRDPRLRAQLFGSVVGLGVFGVVGVSLFDTPYAAFLAVLATWAAIAAVGPNQFGPDGGTFWAYMVSPADLSAALLGKNAALALVAAPLSMTVGLVGAALSGTARYLPAALLASVSVFLIWMAVGNLTSIYGAFPLPERQLFGSNSGAPGRALIVSLLGLMAAGALTAPTALAIGVAEVLGGVGPATAAALAGALYAAVLFRLTVTWIRPIIRERRFALADILDR